MIVAKAKNIDTNLVKLAQKVKQKVQGLRFDVNQTLFNMPVTNENELDQISIEKQRQIKIQKIRILQHQITTDYIEIMSELSDSCIEIMGKPPCKFALVGMGSLARQEITPYSDFENIIVLEEIEQQNAEYETILNYFRWFSVIFQIILINIQETIIPSVAISSLNNHPEHGDWFYDKITTRGISFDGMMPPACKFPLGRQDPTKNKPWTTELIQPISKMLNYLSTSEDLKNGYHLKDILTKTCYVSGDRLIFENFQKQKTQMLDNQDRNTIIDEIRIQTNDDLDIVATRKNLIQLKRSHSINIKKVIYRSTTLFICAMGLLNNTHACSCFDIVEDLECKKKISSFVKNKLMFAVALACETRLRWYMKCKGQNDTMENKTKLEKKSSFHLLSDLIGKTNLYFYFKVAYALQCNLTKNLDSKKFYFYSNPTMLQCILSHCMNDYQRLLFYTKRYLTSTTYNVKRLYTIDECFKILNNKEDEEQLHNLTENKYIDETATEIIFQTGKELSILKHYDEGKEFFEIYLDASKDLNKNDNIAAYFALLKIGLFFIEMQKPKEAKNYFQRSLEIQQRLSGNPFNNKSLSITLHYMGECLMKMNKSMEAMDHFQKSLEIKQ